MLRTPVMNGCIPLSPASSVPARGPISCADAGRWDVASAAVVSGLECYRPTIGTTEHSVIGHSDRGIPSSGAFFPEPLWARRRFRSCGPENFGCLHGSPPNRFCAPHRRVSPGSLWEIRREMQGFVWLHLYLWAAPLRYDASPFFSFLVPLSKRDHGVIFKKRGGKDTTANTTKSAPEAFESEQRRAHRFSLRRSMRCRV